MKLLIEPANKTKIYQEYVDGLILPLKDFAVQSEVYFEIAEIKKIIQNNPSLQIFVNINKNIFNNEIDNLKEQLLQLDNLNITAIMFYDLALLELKQELNLKTDLVWNQSYMVNNYKTCNYYYQKKVNYAYLSKEITLAEIIEISKNSAINTMVEVVGLPTVAFSRRKLITNYFKDINKIPTQKLDILEKVTNKTYQLTEDKNGTNFYLKELVNGTSIINSLYQANIPYIIMKEYGIESNLFTELLNDTKNYIEGNCQDKNYVEKYQKLGDNTNFFFKKTIYQVKKNG